MRNLTVLFVMAMAIFWMSIAWAGDTKILSESEWASIKQEITSYAPDARTSEPLDGAELVTPQSGWHPSCRVCPAYPRCPSGYTQVGYTEVINRVCVQAWGTDQVGPGGVNAIRSDTVVENGVAVHDHIKASHCRKN